MPITESIEQIRKWRGKFPLTANRAKDANIAMRDQFCIVNADNIAGYIVNIGD